MVLLYPFWNDLLERSKHWLTDLGVERAAVGVFILAAAIFTDCALSVSAFV
jgi:hypothetical protein